MKTVIKNKIKILAVVMAIVCLSIAVPKNVWAKAVEETNARVSESNEIQVQQNAQTDVYSDANDSYIISENESHRKEYSKEYTMNDGTITVQEFAEPIHYNENGIWKEIDNTLTQIVDSGKEYLINKANYYQVKLASMLSKDEKVAELENEGKSFHLNISRKLN